MNENVTAGPSTLWGNKRPSTSGGVVDWVKERFVDLMRHIQEKAISCRDHLRNPSLYTGSWMEQIQTV